MDINSILLAVLKDSPTTAVLAYFLWSFSKRLDLVLDACIRHLINDAEKDN
jgi:hypothetical protein